MDCLEENHFSKEIVKIGIHILILLLEKKKEKRRVKQLWMTFVKLVSDDKSGLVLLQLKINDQTLVNLHSPNQDDPDLTRSQELISTGNWNLVFNPQWDSQNYKHISNSKCREKVIDMTNEFSLVDLWRELNTRCKRFTENAQNLFYRRLGFLSGS